MSETFNKKLLIAVDDSPNARRAVTYVAEMFGGGLGFNVLLLHVIPEPEEDFFPDDMERVRWLEARQHKMEEVLAKLRGILLQAGFQPGNVTVKCVLRRTDSLAKAIMDERDQMEASTVVVGRQGISASEEFLFGSVSNRLMHVAKRCAVWIIN